MADEMEFSEGFLAHVREIKEALSSASVAPERTGIGLAR